MTDPAEQREGTTDDPNQADNTGVPRKDTFDHIPEKADESDQGDADEHGEPGTTRDPNQADRT